jgi:hypothetical protein
VLCSRWLRDALDDYKVAEVCSKRLKCAGGKPKGTEMYPRWLKYVLSKSKEAEVCLRWVQGS